METREVIKLVRKCFFDVDLDIARRTAITLVEIVDMSGRNAFLVLHGDGTARGVTTALNGGRAEYNGPVARVVRDLALAF